MPLKVEEDGRVLVSGFRGVRVVKKDKKRNLVLVEWEEEVEEDGEVYEGVIQCWIKPEELNRMQ